MEAQKWAANVVQIPGEVLLPPARPGRGVLLRHRRHRRRVLAEGARGRVEVDARRRGLRRNDHILGFYRLYWGTLVSDDDFGKMTIY